MSVLKSSKSEVRFWRRSLLLDLAWQIPYQFINSNFSAGDRAKKLFDGVCTDFGQYRHRRQLKVSEALYNKGK
jgi:hypothetical protein